MWHPWRINGTYEDRFLIRTQDLRQFSGMMSVTAEFARRTKYARVFQVFLSLEQAYYHLSVLHRLLSANCAGMCSYFPQLLVWRKFRMFTKRMDFTCHVWWLLMQELIGCQPSQGKWKKPKQTLPLVFVLGEEWEDRLQWSHQFKAVFIKGESQSRQA